MILSLLIAGWVLQVEKGQVGEERLGPTQQRVERCPPRQQTWVARFDAEGLSRLGPIAGSGELRDEDEIQACLEAGLRAEPLPEGVMVRLVYENPKARTWEGQVLGILRLVAGPRDECVPLRFPVGPDGTLGAPSPLEGQHPELLAALAAYDKPLPHVPDSLREHYGDAVVLCV